MANKNLRRQENVPGNFYVDKSCIDCDTCRWMAPEIFSQVNGQSAVTMQPDSQGEIRKSLEALFACPTFSIGMEKRESLSANVRQSFPIPVAGNVYHCGFHSESTFGAASYLIQSDSGNILVDVPRFEPTLIQNIERMGGVDWIFLSHRDDWSGHERFASHFNAKRVMHSIEALPEMEEILEGEGPWNTIPQGKILFTPGHTRGHCILLFKDKFLFTGDHLAWSHRLNHLYAFKSACWYDWDVLVESMKRVAQNKFEWVLPGHGRRWNGSREESSRQMRLCLSWMASSL